MNNLENFEKMEFDNVIVVPLLTSFDESVDENIIGHLHEITTTILYFLKYLGGKLKSQSTRPLKVILLTSGVIGPAFEVQDNLMEINPPCKNSVVALIRSARLEVPSGMYLLNLDTDALTNSLPTSKQVLLLEEQLLREIDICGKGGHDVCYRSNVRFTSEMYPILVPNEASVQFWSNRRPYSRTILVRPMPFLPALCTNDYVKIRVCHVALNQSDAELGLGIASKNDPLPGTDFGVSR